MKVFVTGGASHLAQAVLPALCANDAVSAVHAIDTRSAAFKHEKLDFTRCANLDEGRNLVAGCGALVHLDFTSPRPGLTADELFDRNVRSAHKFFHAARAAGVKRLIHLSTAAVYGAAVHAREDAPLKPLPGFLYAEHKAYLEQLLAIDFPDCVRLRPHMILGPHAHPLSKRLLRQPWYARLPDPQPLLQCVHEDDVAEAVLLCLRTNASGAYNIAADDSFSLRDAIRARHRISFALPLFAARGLVTLAARLSGEHAEPVWFDALTRTLLVNCRRAITELGWRSRHTGREALKAT